MSLLKLILLFFHPRKIFKSVDRHIEIVDRIEQGRPVRLLLYDGIRESGMFTDNYRLRDPLFYYMRTLKLIIDHYPFIHNTLLIGGGGFVFPQIYLYGHPDRRMTVVELDPGYVELARKYFGLNTGDKRLNIVISDGLKYINENSGNPQYDMIIYDAYIGDNAARYILSEAVCSKVHSMLKPGGIYALNMVNEAMDVISMDTHLTESTLKKIFAHTRITRCVGGGNCILMASDRKI